MSDLATLGAAGIAAAAALFGSTVGVRRSLRGAHEQWMRDKRGETYEMLLDFVIRERASADIRASSLQVVGIQPPSPPSEVDWYRMHAQVVIYTPKVIRESVDELLRERIRLNNALAEQEELRQQPSWERDTGLVRTTRHDSEAARGRIGKLADTITGEARADLAKSKRQRRLAFPSQ